MRNQPAPVWLAAGAALAAALLVFKLAKSLELRQ
jgi:hypothetical protein